MEAAESPPGGVAHVEVLGHLLLIEYKHIALSTADSLRQHKRPAMQAAISLIHTKER
jgi:hypothetical protein